ncbi:MAG: signal peptidase I [archaeon]
MNGKKKRKSYRDEENPLKKFWYFVWCEDSLASWIVSLILAFIIVKFIFFPVLSFALGTQLPLVVVESCSMYHPGNFNDWLAENSEWYNNMNISNQEIKDWPFKNGLNKGDIVIAYGYGSIKPGQVIIFQARRTHPIIHRVILKQEKITGNYYSTKGDNNFDQLDDEKNIPQDAVIGKSLVRIPYIGWIKLFFVDIYRGEPISSCS